VVILTDAELARVVALLEQRPNTPRREVGRIAGIAQRRWRLALCADDRVRQHLAAARMAADCVPLAHSLRLRCVQAIDEIDQLSGLVHAA
jgi:hypothetical protein